MVEALSAQQRALRITPEGHAELPDRHLYRLGDTLALRFEHYSEASDIDEAIAALQKAVQLTPEGHVDLPGRHKHLGDLLKTRFVSGGNRKDLDECISHCKSAATNPYGPGLITLGAAREWVKLLDQYDPQSPDMIDAPRGNGPRALHLLQKNQLLVPTAVSFAFERDRPYKALEWVWSQLNNLRTPLDDLRIHYPELAQRIADISSRLESAGSPREPAHIPMSEWEEGSAARARVVLAREWEGLLRTARAIPGFGHFLKPAPCPTILQHLPDSGPVVIINIVETGCDALALLAGLDEPLHIPLPNFSLEKAKRYRRQLNTQLKAHVPRARGEEANTVLDGDSSRRGRIDPSSGKAPPRIWWCPTGELSFLSLHAAGVYGESESDSVMDYVVSSYMPTVTALTDRVKNNLPIDETVSGLFLTSQPNAPGRSPIPGTTDEVKSIYAMAKANGVRVLMREGVCILHATLPRRRTIHSKVDSSFTMALSISLLSFNVRHLKNVDLAFLSACETSTGEEKLPDEAVWLLVCSLRDTGEW
ncbi:hypothetical protein D9611_006153 [Ephemerocybe angulata]|uniref:CHAT domain-containing protein n=1 Tax=Ephemerocybe angulata TaxID=980116 RepID=A0A8H5CIK5_9AGAR|nr:hypothetical protein D9611_006153 [Tulosesus angulatus]